MGRRRRRTWAGRAQAHQGGPDHQADAGGGTGGGQPGAGAQQQQQPPGPAEDAGHERRGRINALRASLGKAEDNKSLAKVIAEFGTVIDRAAGRKLTKDGMMFLESVADQLVVVRV